MPLEAIKQVTEAERLSKEKIAQAESKAKTIINDAGKQGDIIIEEMIKKSDAQCKAFMDEAEKQGMKISEDVQKSTTLEQENLKNIAETRMEEAVNLIVGRIVNV